jgi:hypothetical protein
LDKPAGLAGRARPAVDHLRAAVADGAALCVRLLTRQRLTLRRFGALERFIQPADLIGRTLTAVESTAATIPDVTTLRVEFVAGKLLTRPATERLLGSANLTVLAIPTVQDVATAICHDAALGVQCLAARRLTANAAVVVAVLALWARPAIDAVAAPVFHQTALGVQTIAGLGAAGQPATVRVPSTTANLRQLALSALDGAAATVAHNTTLGALVDTVGGDTPGNGTQTTWRAHFPCCARTVQHAAAAVRKRAATAGAIIDGGALRGCRLPCSDASAHVEKHVQEDLLLVREVAAQTGRPITVVGEYDVGEC